MDSEDGNEGQHIWKPLMLDMSRQPALYAEGNPTSKHESMSFCRSSKWCPDGTVALSQSEDRTLQISQCSSTEPQNPAVRSLDVNLVVPQPAPILDFAWYPGATPQIPGSYCFLASVRDCPIKLVDAVDRRLRASYKIVDHRERHVAPHSMAFNGVASHIYCGYEDAIEIFDFQRPGEGTKLATTPSKKSKDGMKGIVSSIAFCPDYSGLFAASSLSGAITLFSEATGEDAIAFLDGITNAVTQVKFNPTHPHLLYASQRRSNDILCWDVREPFEILNRFRRSASATNQKLLFDIDPSGRWLASGDDTGHISIFDVQNASSDPVLKYRAHDDAIGSVAFNPVYSSLLSVSGSRHFPDEPNITFTGSPSDTSDSDSDSNSDSDEVEVGDNDDTDANTRFIRHRTRAVPFVKDASTKVWTFFNVDEESDASEVAATQQ